MVRAGVQFELCDIWKCGLNWGYSHGPSAESVLEDMHRVLGRFSGVRSLGGSYLLIIGTGSNGELRSDFVSEVSVLAEWLNPRSEAFFDLDTFKGWQGYSEVPLAREGDVVYIHLTGSECSAVVVVTVKFDEQPVRATVLGDGFVKFRYEKMLMVCVSLWIVSHVISLVK